MKQTLPIIFFMYLQTAAFLAGEPLPRSFNETAGWSQWRCGDLVFQQTRSSKTRNLALFDGEGKFVLEGSILSIYKVTKSQFIVHSAADFSGEISNRLSVISLQNGAWSVKQLFFSSLSMIEFNGFTEEGWEFKFTPLERHPNKEPEQFVARPPLFLLIDKKLQLSHRDDIKDKTKPEKDPFADE
ncbi:hypothetical protein SAMN02745181_0433 [Rubritalea squalenifaciens DSM 18772]|uniref:Uncharacterized protein n=1 Tax=Rubritalea squalenifaciens DSM 18772 TaxID=1123071 RepID=A0A1M6CAP4_9BACT|nr:hypothetical protein [Rubritalea squalenifaciens]SHI58079.1 hypothetical protein SAMN02745181_0433 [Rubritalea squalenifaciens DSM 18772]